jgi:uncharacterized protein YbjT (DUF2867 family)
VGDSDGALVAGGTGTTDRAWSRALMAAAYEVTATARDEDGAGALADSALADGTIELTAPRAWTYGDPFALFSRLFGRPIRYEDVPLDVAESQFGAAERS